ncbi:DUF6709 family protein [Anaerocolumna aminovalerica]|uniref:DUF6709 family protein n=1 Tax=Anaerocolumna aminovalerica TaxID=1527 RepID=UPI000BE37723|nr:DUF6709 family protein [Anaerocolumna aminovalerica]
MYELLRKKVLKRTIIRMIIALVIIVAYLVYFRNELMGVLTGPVKITEGINLEEYEGKVVTFDANCVLSEYIIFEETNSRTYQRKLTHIGYLAFDEENGNFFGIQLDAKNETQMNLLMDKSIDYFVGDTDSIPVGIQVTGTLAKLKGEELKHFNNTIDYLFANVPDFKDYVIPYVIVNGTIGGINNTAFYIIGSIALVTFLYLIYVIVSFIRGKYTKNFDKYLQNNQTVSLSAIEADFQAAKMFGKEIWIGKHWTIFISGVHGHIHANKDIIWAYYYQRTGKSSVSEVKLYKKDKTITAISASKKLSMEILDYYSNTQPHMIIGYNKETEKLYHKNFTSFLDIKYNEAMISEDVNSY